MAKHMHFISHKNIMEKKTIKELQESKLVFII